MKFIDGKLPRNIHFNWDKNLKPIEYIDSGEILDIFVPDSSIFQIKENSKTEDLKFIDSKKFDGAVGPIYVNGAEPGDALEINILDINIGNWGWSALLKDFGLLKNEFDDKLIIWHISDGYAQTNNNFLKNIRIPVNPFLGVIGVAPKNGIYGMIPPQYFGGNMDNKILSKKGSKLIIPVFVKGALFSIGDPHAAQGDGEVCGTAIEAQANVKIKINVIKNYGKKILRGTTKGYNFKGDLIISMGIGKNIYNASKMAVKNMIEIMKNYGLSPEETYVLCSIIGDLRISEIVDYPNFLVSCTLPRKILKFKK